ncbi:MAG: hypothetical protein JWO86_6387 [Myxococcaceae bacterium]|jgi:hypothetical protein|nr:hypothetical protein [Myxococcaceae bacterium]
MSALLWLSSGCVAFAVYSNVLADDSEVRVRAESVARAHAGCGARCQVTRMVGRRSVIDLQADYDIEGSGTVHVECRRSAIVAGDHECSVR